MSISQVTVTGTVNDADGRPGVGQVIWALSGPIRDGSALFVSPNTQAIPLVGGTFEVTVYANDDPTTLPADSYYTVTFEVGSEQWSDAYVIPYNAPGGTVDIADLDPVVVGDVTSTVAAASLTQLSAETARAEAAEQANAEAVSAETQRAEGAEALLASAAALTAETSRAKGAESTNASAISTETTRAKAAETAAIAQAEAYVQSRGQNLFTNGLGGLGSNYNMSACTFDTVDAPYGRGSFLYTTPNANSVLFASDEMLPVDSSRLYRIGCYAKAGNLDGSGVAAAGTSAGYIGVYSYDIDGKTIQPYQVIIGAGSMTTLAADLNPGDTTISLTSAANWFAGSTTANALNGMSWYPYVNKEGYSYPYDPTGTVPAYAGTNTSWQTVPNALYSSISGNVLQLNKPWSGPALTAGTSVANAHSGGYSYIAMAGQRYSTEWTWYEGTLNGTQQAVNQAGRFVPGAAFVRLTFLMNYTANGQAGNTFRFADIQLTLVDNGLWLPAPAGQNGWDTSNLVYRRTNDAHIEFDGYITNTVGTTPNGGSVFVSMPTAAPNCSPRTGFYAPVWATGIGQALSLQGNASGSLVINSGNANTAAQTIYLTGVRYPMYNT